MESNTIKHSVIIPFYNAADTLNRCLNSLVRQLDPFTEILMVSDGSTDNGEEICTDYMKRFSQIKLYTKENGGVSSARNLGLDHAAGEYILFLDADDSVSSDYFSVIDRALEQRPDLLLFNVQTKKSRARLIRQCSKMEIARKGEMQCAHFLAKALKAQDLNLITSKAFRRDVIEANHIRFDERLDIGEDKVFAFTYSLHVRTLCQIPDYLYHLSIDREDSLSRKKRENLYPAVLLEHQLLNRALEHTALDDPRRTIYQAAIHYSFFRSAYSVCGKLHNLGLSPIERRRRIRSVLDLYSTETEFHPSGLRCHCIAFPIRRRFVFALDCFVSLLRRDEVK